MSMKPEEPKSSPDLAQEFASIFPQA